MNNINNYILEQADYISKYLMKLFKSDMESDVLDAMKYSISAGGKRIRPLLTLEFARACNGNIDAAVKMGCAVEMIHTYSLIHDDLPCMDNDDMRRGKPACHIIAAAPRATHKVSICRLSVLNSLRFSGI